MNFAVTDGETVVCTRYITDKHKEGASLYFSSGTRFESYKPGHYRMIKADKREDIVVIASGKMCAICCSIPYLLLDCVEPLTFEKTDWLTIPSNTLVIITPKLNVLLYPIKDRYYNPGKRESWF
jgi:glutamine amidotransferase